MADSQALIRKNVKSKYPHIDEDGIELEASICGLCGENDFEVLVKSCNIKQRCKMEYRVVKCLRCGLARLNPRPTVLSMQKYYLVSDPEKIARKPAFYEKIYFSIFRHISLKQKGRLLDIGCGSGRYIYTMRDKGWDVFGIDIGHTDYGRSVLGLDIREGTLADAHFDADSFDAVTLWWTLEHMHEPLVALKEAHRILKRNGVLIIGVHNIDSVEAKLFKKYWFHLFLPKHLYHFSPDSLMYMLKKSGFTKVKIRNDLFSFGIIGSIQCYLNAKGINISFINPLFYILSLPLDIILGLARKSGLITAYAYKK